MHAGYTITQGRFRGGDRLSFGGSEYNNIKSYSMMKVYFFLFTLIHRENDYVYSVITIINF